MSETAGLIRIALFGAVLSLFVLVPLAVALTSCQTAPDVSCDHDWHVHGGYMVEWHGHYEWFVCHKCHAEKTEYTAYRGDE